MLSSTFTDLKEHRARAIEVISKLHYMPSVMEHSGAQAEGDVIDTSLDMVRNAAAYIGVIGLKYGQAPFDPVRNPDRLSITELEFNEAMRLGRPMVLFIMGPDHLVRAADIESDPEKRIKLDEFRERAKKMRNDAEVQRVYEVFSSLEQFSTAAATAIGNLIRLLERNERRDLEVLGEGAGLDGSTDQRSFRERGLDTGLPRPPALAAVPRYLGSHSFVGRESELLMLSDWCDAADPNSMLLLEAVGGSGKSMLTWEWLTKHSTRAREDWAGRFWYSFYEKGAVMTDFCCAALAYMTDTDPSAFRKLRTQQLFDRLIAQLERNPWLLVLDGLERVLVAYHRHDAAQMLDSDAGVVSDQIAGRDNWSSIRPEDDRLLRRLADAVPSKILVSSRLMPRALINSSRAVVPGVRRQLLPGLRPVDAETMVRSSGVFGDSIAIRAYLQRNCDCHPLVVGALAGLINDYPPDRGNFDRWSEDPKYGMSLNLGQLDLVQRKNHILETAIGALDQKGRRLLHLLSLLRSAVDFKSLEALAIVPNRVNDPDGTDPNISNANDLGMAIRDLEQRGLLQYDLSGKRYDLHPVVRGVAVERINQEETSVLGQKVLDHFTSRQHVPWNDAQKLEDVSDGIQVVSAFLRMKRYSDAFYALAEDLANALHYNVGADPEFLSLIRGFFPEGWDNSPALTETTQRWYITNCAAVLLSPARARELHERAILLSLNEPSPDSLYISLCGFANCLSRNEFLAAERLRTLAAELVEASRDPELLFMSKFRAYSLAVRTGNRQLADELWAVLEHMGRDWRRGVYRPGEAETERALDLLNRGELTEQILTRAEEVVARGNSIWLKQNLREIRGEWYLARKDPDRAIDCFSEALTWCRERGLENHHCEARLALARLRAGESCEKAEVERLSTVSEDADSVVVAELWQELGEPREAVKHARRAYLWAVQQEPYVPLDCLDGAVRILADCSADLPPFIAIGHEDEHVFLWEAAVRSYVGKLQMGNPTN